MSSGRVMMKSFHQEQAVSTTKVVIINEKKQGIVSILGSDDGERTKGGVGTGATPSLSLRRTLSADMSSKKWLAQNDFRPIMKKIASSEELLISSSFSSSSSSSSEGGEDDQEEELQRPGQDEVWISIQSQKQKEEDNKANSNGWTWASILTQKNDEDEGESKDNQNQTPYIHPLVKRSTSSLSEKSLEICTENLGSETGSDGFSSYPPSDAGDSDEEKQQQSQQQFNNDNNNTNSSYMEEDLEIKSVNYNYNNRKILQSRSFPPPLPSLAAREDGASLHMNSHRQNGRLVLEAVSVPSQNYFHAQRQDGRLVLTLINNPNCEEMEEEDIETEDYARVFDNIEEENEDEFLQDQDEDDDEFKIGEEEEEEEEQMEEKSENKRSLEMEYYLLPEQISRFEGGGSGGGVGVGLMNVHKSALVMKKVMAINNKNLIWTPNFNKSVNRMIEFEEEEEEGEEGDDEQLTAQIPQSLPPPPRLISTAAQPAAAASLNAYEYFWRQQKPSVANIIKQIPPPPQQQSLKTKEMMNHQNDAAATRNSKGNHYYHSHHEQKMQNNNNAEYNLVRRCNETRKSLLLWGEPYCIATS